MAKYWRGHYLLCPPNKLLWNMSDIDVNINIGTASLHAVISVRYDQSQTRGRAAVFQGRSSQDSDLDVSC